MAIGNELENPKRVLSMKKKLQVGMELGYFDHVKNRLVKSKLLEIVKQA